jgi:hypothetical protein
MNCRLAQYRPYSNRLLRKDPFSVGELLNFELLTVVSTDFGEVVSLRRRHRPNVAGQTEHLNKLLSLSRMNK